MDTALSAARVFTFSMHCEGNLFSARQYSDLDVDVPIGAGDETYMALLQEHLPSLFERASPDLCFFQAGVCGPWESNPRSAASAASCRRGLADHKG